jgi:hypothetical protein
MNSSKTDEYDKKETLQISKNIERNISKHWIIFEEAP